jgi:DNA-binding FadR family transcriptional regulator
MELWKQKAEAGEPAPGIDEEFHRTLYGALNNQTFMKLFEVFWIPFENLMGKGLVFQAKTPARVWDSSHRMNSMGFLEG